MTPVGIAPRHLGVLLQCEQHETNAAAVHRACALSESEELLSVFVIGGDGDILWSNPELLHECDRRIDHDAKGPSRD